MQRTHLHFLLLSFFVFLFHSIHSSPSQQTLELSTTFFSPPLPRISLSSSKKFEGSSDLVNLRYHMGPVLSSSPIKIYLIWYGNWASPKQDLIRDFILSISPQSSAVKAASPTVSKWWQTASLYDDQTGGNVSRKLLIAHEFQDRRCSIGMKLTRFSIQRVIAGAVSAAPIPVDQRNGIYLILTSEEVFMEEFCRAVCGFHYFTFPSIVGHTMPYAWIGNSEKQCPGMCAYPFAIPAYMSGSGLKPLKPPNGNVGVEGMISVIAHELAEVSTNPLINAWYAGEDPMAPTEIGDLCEGLYGSGGGGAYIGQVMKDGEGKAFNMWGRKRKKFFVQWIWSPVLKACAGPNALD